MAYELVIPLKRGHLEIEADSVKELERRVKALDLPALERLVAAARSGKGRRKPARKA